MKINVKKIVFLLIACGMLAGIARGIYMVTQKNRPSLPETALKAGSRNLALGADISATLNGNAYSDSTELKRAIDGSLATYPALHADTELEVILDLKKAYQIECIKIVSGALESDEEEVYISEDGITWKQVLSDLSTGYGAVTGKQISDGVFYRYVKVTAKETANDKKTFMPIQEIEVYAQDTMANPKPYNTAKATVSLAEGEEYTRFAIMSDTHIVSAKDGGAAKLRRALDVAYSWGVDAIAINGDITSTGRTTQYAALEDIFNNHAATADIPKFLVMGNHEHDGASDLLTMEERVDRFEQMLEAVNGGKTHGPKGNMTANSVNTVGNAVVITVGMENWEDIGEANYDWLKGELDRLATGDTITEKPIFLLAHNPPAQTIYKGSNWGRLSGLHDILKNYPQVTAFSGHLHYSLESPDSFWQGEYSVISTGGIYGAVPQHASFWNTVKDGKRTGNYEMVLAEVDSKGVVRLTPYNITGKEPVKINDGYIYKPSDTSSFVYNTYNRKVKSGSPAFPEDAVLTVRSVTDKSVSIGFPRATDPDVVGGVKGIVTCYRIEVEDSEGNPVTFKDYQDISVQVMHISGRYWNDASTDITAKINGLAGNTDYKLIVTPIDEWETFGEPLEVKITTKDVVPSN